MEGFAEQYNYDDDAWDKKFIRVSPELLHIYKSEKDEKPEKTYNIVGSRAKKLKRTQFNKENVFKVEIGVIKLVFSVSDDELRKSFIHYFRNATKRVSLIANKAKRISISQSKRESLSVLTRTDLIGENFNLEEYVKSYDYALENKDTQNAQLNYTKLCAKFLSITHQQIETAIKQGTDIKVIDGLSIQEIPQNEKHSVEKRIASLAWVASQQIEYLYVPLLSMFNSRGKSYLVSTDLLHPRKKLTNASNTKLLHLKMQIGATDAIISKFNVCEDKKNRLWVLDASSLFDIIEGDDTCVNFAKELNQFKYFVFDSVTLNSVLNQKHLLTQHLPTIARLVTNYHIKQVVEVELIARACTDIFNSQIDQTKEYYAQIIEFFNNVLLDDMTYWNSTLAQYLNQNYQFLIPPKVTIPRFMLFLALQNMIGIEFVDSKDYNFDTKFNESQILHEHVIPYNMLLESCYYVRRAPKNELTMFADMKYEECCASLNERAAVIQTLFGEQNQLISTVMGLLAVCYCFTGNLKFAKLCYETCKTTNREVSPIIGLASVSTETYDQGAPLIEYCLSSDFHWFTSLFYHTAAIIEYRGGAFQMAREFATKAQEDTIFEKSLVCLIGKIMISSGNINECKSFIESKPDTPYKTLLQAEILYQEKFYEESLKLAKESYKEFCYYADEFIAYENVQILANNFDVLCDFENAFIFYNSLFMRDFSGESENKTPSCRVIARNIIRLFFKSLAIKDASKVGEWRKKALSTEFPNNEKLLDEICANGPVEYLKSAKEDVFPQIYKLIL